MKIISIKYSDKEKSQLLINFDNGSMATAPNDIKLKHRYSEDVSSWLMSNDNNIANFMTEEEELNQFIADKYQYLSKKREKEINKIVKITLKDGRKIKIRNNEKTRNAMQFAVRSKTKKDALKKRAWKISGNKFIKINEIDIIEILDLLEEEMQLSHEKETLKSDEIGACNSDISCIKKIKW